MKLSDKVSGGGGAIVDVNGDSYLPVMEEWEYKTFFSNSGRCTDVAKCPVTGRIFIADERKNLYIFNKDLTFKDKLSYSDNVVSCIVDSALTLYVLLDNGTLNKYLINDYSTADDTVDIGGGNYNAPKLQLSVDESYIGAFDNASNTIKVYYVKNFANSYTVTIPAGTGGIQSFYLNTITEIYLASSSNIVYKKKTNDDTLLGATTAISYYYRGLELINDVLYGFSFDGGYLDTINVDTDTISRLATLSYTGYSLLPSIDNKYVFTGGYYGEVSKIKLSDGSVIKTIDTGTGTGINRVFSMISVDNKIYCASDNQAKVVNMFPKIVGYQKQE